MPAKIRLQRRGSKGRPFYHIVVADGRAPRDGRFIEKIGTYNPLTKPADIVLDFDKALNWLQNGAQPTDTARAILSFKGVMYKNHLLKGVAKGALTEEQAQVKFDAWLNDKEAKIAQKLKDSELETKTEAKARLDAERKVNEARAAAIAEKRSALAEEAAREAGTLEEIEADVEAEVPEALTEEAPVEEPKAEAPAEEPKAEAPAEEPKAEAPAEEPKAEAPAEEAKAEEAPAKEETKED